MNKRHKANEEGHYRDPALMLGMSAGENVLCAMVSV